MWRVSVLSVAVFLAAIACGVESTSSENALPTVNRPPVEVAETRTIVINAQGDEILYAEDWALDGPDEAETVALSTGTPDNFRIVTVRRIELPSEDETLFEFSDRERHILQDTLGLSRPYSATKEGDGESNFWMVDFQVNLSSGPATGVERHLIHDGFGYVVQGVWTNNTDPVLSAQVDRIVRSFVPEANPSDEFEGEVRQRTVFDQAGEVLRAPTKLSLGHYLALEDSSLWEVALSDRLLAMKIGDNEKYLVAAQPVDATFPYVLAHTPGSIRLPAFYVGKGEGILR